MNCGPRSHRHARSSPNPQIFLALTKYSPNLLGNARDGRTNLAARSIIKLGGGCLLSDSRPTEPLVRRECQPSGTAAHRGLRFVQIGVCRINSLLSTNLSRFPETIVSENGSRQRKRLTRQHLLEYFQQRPGCIRLLQESRQTLPRKPLDGFHLVIAAGQDHRNRRMNGSQFPERGLPA